MLDKEAFLPSHKYLVDKARILHSIGKINVSRVSFSYYKALFKLILEEKQWVLVQRLFRAHWSGSINSAVVVFQTFCVN